MTKEQIEKMVKDRYGDHFNKWGGQRDGMREVLNNPEKYGLMAIPSVKEIQDWFTGGNEVKEGFWQENEGIVLGDVFVIVLNIFEHFKNRK